MSPLKIVTILFTPFLLFSCSTPSKTDPQMLQPGLWEVQMDIGAQSIPLRFQVDSAGTVSITNGDERIITETRYFGLDSFLIVMPRFESLFEGKQVAPREFSGVWTNLAKEDYHLPFSGKFVGITKQQPKTFESSKYEVTFSPDTPDEYPAIGVISQNDNQLRGTFLTETGDYRFLEGEKNGQEFYLSCFDGAHMFLFNAKFKGDSVVDGMFYSGKHWEESWEGVLNTQATLTHPDSLTHLLSSHGEVAFDVRSTEGDSVHFGRENYLNQVTIIQIFGSWCPNCWDENLFYKSLYDDYATRGLQIIPVAFEASDDFDKNAAAVKKQFASLGIEYPAYIAGKRSKKRSSEMFHMLNAIISYPTSIFIEKQGEVRKIHTGFYGPGTGDYYTEYVTETRAFIEALLDE